MIWRHLFALGAAALVGWTAWLAWHGGLPVQTDLLAMLPRTERNPTAELALARVAQAQERRIVILVAGADANSAIRAAEAAATRLRAAGAMRQVNLRLPPDAAQAASDFYLKHRFSLLSQAGRQRLADDRDSLQAALLQGLANPAGLASPLPLGADPLGLFADFLADLPGANNRLALHDGYLLAREDTRSHCLISAEVAGSAHDRSVQATTVAALAQAREAALSAGATGFTATGLTLYAEAAQTQASREVSLIGYGSLAGSVVLLWLAFGSLRHVFLAAFLMVFGVAAGTLAALALFGELHLLTVVCGASLIGVVIDYAIHYFARQAEAGARWQPVASMRVLLPGLTLGLVTTLLGYLVMGFMPFPGLRQVALFSAAGLSAAFLATVVILPAFCTRPLAGPSRLSAWTLSAFARWESWLRTRARRLLGVFLLAALPGWWLLGHDDDIHVLVSPPPALAQDEARIRALTGLGQDSRFFLVEGRDAEQVLVREEALSARLAEAKGDGLDWLALSRFVPSQARQASNREHWRHGLVDADRPLAQAMQAVGFRDQATAALAQALYAQRDHGLTVTAWLAQPFSTPYRMLWLGPSAHGQASVVLPQGRWSDAALTTAVDGLEGVTLVNKPAAVSRLMGQYRQGLTLALGIAILLSVLLLTLRYGWRGAVRVALPCLLATGLTLAVLGYLGQAVTLFHWLALVLVFAMAVDYGIFVREGGREDSAAFLGIILAACATLMSYALLALSSLPALSGFGLSLFLGITSATLLAPLALPPALSPAISPEEAT